MDKKIDARGLQCPMPVIETKKALQEMTKGSVEVIVDNSIAVQNLVKMAKQKQLEFTSEMVSEDYYFVRMEVGAPALQANVTKDVSGTEAESEESCYPDIRLEKTVIVLSSDRMGSGDEKLGQILMKGFVYALTELEQLPKQIVLYNSGAKLSAEGSDSLEDLKLLESQGVEILTCGTCLNYYNLTEKLAVGTVTNMYAIAEILMSAGKVIKP
ncbi:MAG: SirA family protein [Anaerocolumna sp.]|nr:SirA family protein [Anaerocolumna sp.]